MSNPTSQPSTSTPTSTSDDIPDYLVPVLAVFDDLSTAARREHVTTLYCRGYRTAAISTMLGVPVRTLNRWLKDARYLLASESRADREEHLLRAIESARAIAAEAWAAYERDCQLQREILAGQHDRLRRRVTRLGRPPRRRLLAPNTPSAVPSPDQPVVASGGRPETSDSARPPSATPAPTGLEAAEGDILYEEYERPRYTSQAARLLTLALAAQREVARLQGLYQHVEPPRQPVDVTFSGPTPAAPATSFTPDPNAASSDAQPDAQPGPVAQPPAATQPEATPTPDLSTASAATLPSFATAASTASTAQSAALIVPASHSAPPPAAAPASSAPAASTPAAPNGLATPSLAPATATPQTSPSPPSEPTAPATPASAVTPSTNPPATVTHPSTMETG